MFSCVLEDGKEALAITVTFSDRRRLFTTIIRTPVFRIWKLPVHNSVAISRRQRALCCFPSKFRFHGPAFGVVIRFHIRNSPQKAPSPPSHALPHPRRYR